MFVYYKLFLSLIITDFNLFMWNLQRPWKKSPPLSQKPTKKFDVLSIPLFFKTCLEVQPLPFFPRNKKERVVHTI